MEQTLYNGSSDSFGDITSGYIDYAMTIIIARAFPDIRDGLKPGARRILYTSNEHRKDYLIKTADLVGKALSLHPHGDGSVYNTLALMTDSNGTYNRPFYQGKGDLGDVYSSNSPAAMRYTKAMLKESAVRDLFSDIDCVKFVPAEEGEGLEPEVLPAAYPVVLTNGTQGIGVSVSANIPSFNFGDVIDMTVKYLREGELSVNDLIIPDFPTGGILVNNEEEVAKIMLTGKGKLKLRARVEIEGKEIILKEVPYGKTIESITSLINKADMKEIVKVHNIDGHDSPGLLAIECKTKKCVEYTLMELYRRNILQSVFSSNILAVEGTEPLIVGVHEIIRRWCKWRVEIVRTRYTKYLASIEPKLKQLSYMVRLTSNEEWRDIYVDTVLRKSKQDADAYLVSLFEDIPQEVCDWIHGRSLTSFRKAGKYQTNYDNLLKEKEEYEGYLNNITEKVISELLSLKESEKGTYERKTEITYTDYKFSKISDSTVVDTSYAVFTLTKDGFLKKTKEVISDDNVLCSVEATASSILVGFDNYGRVLKVVGSEIPFTAYGEDGVYMPKHFEATFQDDYRVMYLGLLDGKRRMLIYRDGYVGFFDTSEWVGKKVVKVVSQGVDLHVYDLLVEVIEEDDIPEFLLVADYDGKGRCRFGAASVENIPIRSRRSRAKVFYGTDPNIEYLKGFSYMDLMCFLKNVGDYVNKMKVLRMEDLEGDSEELVEGRYTLLDYSKSSIEG